MIKKLRLGRSDLTVSEYCLGTMTFSNQTPESDAFAQMDRAMDFGIDFLDVAEMYPVNPVRAETVGNSEKILGAWLARRGKRDDVHIATKVTGENGGFCRDGEPISGAAIRRAIEGSLSRLGTDYVDLYQFHWPNRGSYAFRQNWDFDPSGKDVAAIYAHFDEVLQTLADLVKDGKIRAFGLSNDSAWGTLRLIDRAEKLGAPRVASVQNEYSLLYRLYDTDMAELSCFEDVTLLSYSPLAAGLLTGKYQGGETPEASRAAVDIEHGGKGNLGGRRTDRALAAVSAYQALAQEHGWDLTHMALVWQRQRPFPIIPILGATTDAQLAHQLDGLNKEMPRELYEAIEQLHRIHALPY